MQNVIAIKISGCLQQSYRDETNATLTDSESFKSYVKMTGRTTNNGKSNDVKIAVPLST